MKGFVVLHLPILCITPVRQRGKGPLSFIGIVAATHRGCLNQITRVHVCASVKVAVATLYHTIDSIVEQPETFFERNKYKRF